MQNQIRGFLRLVDRVRMGDEYAVRVFLDRYGDTIRREVRFRLLDRRLRRVVGVCDVYQSVVSRFLFDLMAGSFDLDCPQDVVKLLKAITRRRVAQEARYWSAHRRDVRRNESLDRHGEFVAPYGGASPCDRVAVMELAEKAELLLSDRDRLILKWREDGVVWAEVALRVGGQPEAVRKQHQRSMARVATALLASSGVAVGCAVA